MRMLKTVLILFLLLLPMEVNAAPVVFNLKPITLTNGWRIAGTVTTDGTVGQLTAANFVDWNLKVVQTTDFVWTEKDSNAFGISSVTTDGNKIFVPTSPDGVRDGGALFFSRGGGGGQIATNVVVADFTQLSSTLGYPGGMAGWQDEIWGLNYVDLNQANHTRYRAASLLAGRPNVFQVHVPTIATNPLLMTVFGTITTDGTIGTLLSQNILAWNITARNQDITYYTPAKSTVMAATRTYSDGVSISIAHAGGQFKIGISGARPTFVAIADFTDHFMPGGFANYYIGNYGIMGEKTPLVAPGTKGYKATK